MPYAVGKQSAPILQSHVRRHGEEVKTGCVMCQDALCSMLAAIGSEAIVDVYQTGPL